jgi:hypothetical protein
MRQKTLDRRGCRRNRPDRGLDLELAPELRMCAPVSRDLQEVLELYHERPGRTAVGLGASLWVRALLIQRLEGGRSHSRLLWDFNCA